MIRFVDDDEIVLTRRGPRTYGLTRPFRYQDSDYGTITVPRALEDFDTDLTSLPWFTAWFVPKLGEHVPAVILHDALVGDDGVEPTYRTRDGLTISRDDADSILLDAMVATNTPLFRRLTIWSGTAVDAAVKQHRVRGVAWIVLLLGLSGFHLFDILDLIHVFPYLGNWNAFAEWGVAMIATTCIMAVTSFVLLPSRYIAPALWQSLVFGLAFLPVLLMLPARALLVCIPERSLKKCLR